MRSVVFMLVLVWWTGGPLWTQTVWDLPLPPGLPAVLEGPHFARGDALAVSGAGSIHFWTGLPNQPQHQVLVPAGPQAMADRWQAASQEAAVYRSVGQDLVGQTGDDEIILVTGLPQNPLLIPTGLMLPTTPAVVPVNRYTTVLVTDSGLFALSFNGTSAQVSWHPASEPLLRGGAYSFGRASEDAVLGLLAGPDHQGGTPDDRLVVLHGLAQADPAAYLLEDFALPPGTDSEGFLTSAEGVGGAWRAASLPDMHLVTAIWSAGAPQYQITTVTPGTMSTVTGCGASAPPGGGLDLYCTDDLGPGEGHALVAQLTATPVVLGTWYDDFNAGGASVVTAPDEVARLTALFPTGFSYTRYLPGASATLNLPFPQNWNNIDFLKPHPAALAVFADTLGPAGWSAEMIVLADLFGTSAPVSHSMPGSLAGGGVGVNGEHWPARVMALSPGRVASFVASPGATNPTDLWVASVPSAVNLASGNSLGPSPIGLVLSPAVPTGSGPVQLFMSLPAGFDPSLLLMVALERGAPLQLAAPPFAAGALFHLGLQGPLLFLPQNLGGGFSQLTLDPAPLIPALSGQPLYIQALAEDAQGSFQLSDLLLLVLG